MASTISLRACFTVVPITIICWPIRRKSLSKVKPKSNTKWTCSRYFKQFRSSKPRLQFWLEKTPRSSRTFKSSTSWSRQLTRGKTKTHFPSTWKKTFSSWIFLKKMKGITFQMSRVSRIILSFLWLELSSISLSQGIRWRKDQIKFLKRRLKKKIWCRTRRWPRRWNLPRWNCLATILHLKILIRVTIHSLLNKSIKKI